MAERTVRVRALAGLLAPALLAPALLVSAAPAASARLDPGSAPTPRDDVVTVFAGGTRGLQALANDSDPDGDDLEICRMGTVDRGLRAGEPGRWAGEFLDLPGAPVDDLMVEAGRGTAGQVLEAVYYACDETHLAPATVRVRVKRSRPLVIRPLEGEPGSFTLRNTQPFQMWFTWAWRSRQGDYATSTRVGEGRTLVFSIPVRRGTWTASNVQRGYADRGRLQVRGTR